MKTLNEATTELLNKWHDIRFTDGNTVQIIKDGRVVESAEMKDINNDAEVISFIKAFLMDGHY